MLSFRHGNEEGTGSCLEVDIMPAKADKDGIVTINIWPQTNSIQDADWQGPKFATSFNGVGVDLGAGAVAHVLAVLDGSALSILGNKGLRGSNDDKTTVLHVDRVTKPFEGYAFHIKTKFANGEKADGRIVLSLTEGAALRDAIRASMGKIAFG